MGIASLIGSGYLAINGSKSGTIGSTQPTPTNQSSSTSAPPVPPEHTGAVAVTTPTYGSKVAACAVFSGTSDLPPGETLVLSARNLSDPTRTSYLEPVNNWTVSSEISQWTGYQYFGSGNSSVGQTYEVDVLIIKTSTVRAALAQPKNNPAWAVKSLPSGTHVKATLRVVRKAAPGPAVCQ